MEMQPPANTAAWLTSVQAKLEVLAAPYTRPRENEIVVKNRAVAINPIDWVIQVAGNMAFTWIRLPFILGSDLAGEVVDIGSGVTRFAIGDRVLAHALGTDAKRNSSAEGSFQTYTVVLEVMTSPIPSDMSFGRATRLATRSLDRGLRALSERLSGARLSERVPEAEREDVARLGRLDERR